MESIEDGEQDIVEFWRMGGEPLSLPPPEIHGEAVIRDKNGNIKGRFTFRAAVTK